MLFIMDDSGFFIDGILDIWDYGISMDDLRHHKTMPTTKILDYPTVVRTTNVAFRKTIKKKTASSVCGSSIFPTYCV